MKYVIFLILTSCSTAVLSQSATYKLVNSSNGSSSNISITQTADQLDVNILADWNSKTGKYGQLTGKGVLANHKCTIKADSTACRVKLEFVDDKLNVEFDDCVDNLIPEDFSGTYTKIADNIPGEYVVTSEISFFYSKPDLKARKKGFSSRSQILNIEEVYKGNWGFATLMTNGKHSFGYVKLTDLRLKKTYLYDQ
jgi:hypothetical protein